MVNKKFWLGLLVTVLVFGTIVITCTGNEIDGIWDCPDEGVKVKFENGKFQFLDHERILFDVTYIIKGNTLILNGHEEVPIKFSVVGNTLTIEGLASDPRKKLICKKINED